MYDLNRRVNLYFWELAREHPGNIGDSEKISDEVWTLEDPRTDHNMKTIMYLYVPALSMISDFLEVRVSSAFRERCLRQRGSTVT